MSCFESWMYLNGRLRDLVVTHANENTARKVRRERITKEIQNPVVATKWNHAVCRVCTITICQQLLATKMVVISNFSFCKNHAQNLMVPNLWLFACLGWWLDDTKRSTWPWPSVQRLLQKFYNLDVMKKNTVKPA